MASVFLISLYVLEEINYDSFHEGAENIYRIEWHSDNPQTRTPHPMAQAMVQEFPEVISAVTLSPLWESGLTRETFSIRNLEKDLRYDEKGVLGVDTTFFDVFSFPILRGNGKEALKKMGTILISQSMAKKYFGDEDPIGKILAINDDHTFLEVAAIFADVPLKSHFHFDFLLSYNLLKALEDSESKYYEWADFGHYNYIKLHPEADVKALEAKLLPWVARHLVTKESEIEDLMSYVGSANFKLRKLTDIHLHSNILWELEANGNMEYIIILMAAALFILVIACSNFINLTTSKSAERAKEIGIRKSLGAYRKQLAGQFLSESILVCLIAMLLAGLITEMFLPTFSYLSGKPMDVGIFSELLNLAIIFAIALIIGLISGIYPAFLLSSIKPGLMLKGRFSGSRKGSILKNVLVVLQFTISMVLITATLLVYNQLDFLQNRPLGFNKEGLMVVPIHSDVLRRDFETLKHELEKIEGIQGVSATSNIPGSQYNQHVAYKAEDPKNTIAIFECFVDYDLFNIYNLEIISGRSFNLEADNGETRNYIINEAAAKQLQLENPIGSEFIIERYGRNDKGTVIGVVKDFNFQSLHQPVRPLVFHPEDNYNYALIKMELGNLTANVSRIEDIWLSVNNDYNFEFSFLDENLNQQYLAESRMGNIFMLFSIIAVIIACLGLFGLASLNFQYRKKEVGVRKVMGASISSLLLTLNKDFTKLVIAAIIVGIPVSWIFMEKWLSNFTFKVSINPGYFAAGAIILLLVAIATLSYLTLRTATLNPVDILKDE